jgi:hypothetical protein
MQNKQLPESLAQLAGLLGFTATFFPGILTGTDLLMLLFQSIAISLILGAVIWFGIRSLQKWQMEQLKPVLEEIEVPAPRPIPVNRRRPNSNRSVRIKG